MTRFSLRFLWVVSPHFKQSVILVMGATAFGTWTIRAMPGDVGAPYALLLVCQLFAASSGFRLAANAGHFDTLLVKGVTRTRLALCHWGLSISPGLAAWLAVSGIEAWSLGPANAVGARPASLAGLLVVSNVCWGATLPGARFLGGTAWLLLMALIGSSRLGVSWMESVLGAPAPDAVLDALWGTGALLAVPFMFLVPAAGGVAGSVPVLVTSLVLSGVAVGIGVLWIGARDFAGGV